jgi:hypothetical protein
MSYAINAGLSVSLDNNTWYHLTDDNRSPIKIAYEIIDKTNRMADGTLRRYVIANKHKITTDWKETWSRTLANESFAGTSDGAKGGSWLKSFYEINVFNPVYVKLSIAGNYESIGGVITPVADDTYYSSSYDVSTGSSNFVYATYITSFDYTVNKRNINFDLVDITIEFTEI